MQRRTFIASSAMLAVVTPAAWGHHGWSSFDQSRPIYLDGTAAKVLWANPHTEMELELPADMPAQSANVDGPALLKAAQVPTRKDRRWQIELAPLSRMNAWQVPEIKNGDRVALLGFTFAGEKGDAILRAEYVFVGGKTYGLRSSPG